MSIPAEEYQFSARTGSSAVAVRDFQAAVYRQRYGRVPDDGCDERAVFLIATDHRGDVVASARVIINANRPFSFEKVLDVATMEGVGSEPAEIGRWCIRQDHRDVAKARGLHFGLMKMVYLFGRAKAVSDYLMYVYPDLERFYRGLFFKDLGVPFEHPDWGPVRMFSLNLRVLDAKLRVSDTSLARYLLSSMGSNFKIGSG